MDSLLIPTYFYYNILLLDFPFMCCMKLALKFSLSYDLFSFSLVIECHYILDCSFRFWDFHVLVAFIHGAYHFFRWNCLVSESC